MVGWFLALLLCAGQTSAARLSAHGGLSLNADAGPSVSQVGMVITHDAGTGYYPGGASSAMTCAKYQTQSVGFTAQLSCGARSMDLRLEWSKKDSRFYYYHGPIGPGKVGNVRMDITLAESMTEVKKWASAHPSELVVLAFGHYDNEAQLISEVAAQDIYVWDCKTKGTLGAASMATVKQTVKKTYGSVVAIFDCMNDNFGTFEGIKYEQWDNLNLAINKTVAQYKSSVGELWQSQGIWQLVDVVTQETLEDNTLSSLNSVIASKWGAIGKASGGLWLADNICVGGLDLAQALGTTVTAADKSECQSLCATSTNKCGAGNCASKFDTNGCCFCTTEKKPCDKHGLGSANNFKCEKCTGSVDCGLCPKYGAKC